MSPRSPVTAFPTARESLVLQASLLDGEPALAAWKQISDGWGPAAPGFGWMAPLLMSNLRRLLPEEPWLANNPHFLTLCRLKEGAISEFAQRALLVLEEAAVPTMILKGLALGVTVYPSPELRTLSDIDILVPGRDFFRAMAALEEGGFRPAPRAPLSSGDLRRNHAHVFFSTRRHEPLIDLHWHVLASARRDDDDEPFWREARPLRVGRANTSCLCPEDQLLHILVHGVRWTRVPHVRWVADAALILRAAGDGFRTEHFLENVRRFDATAPVQEGLSFVAGLVGEGRPLLDQVRQLKVSVFSRRAFRARATSYEDRTFSDRLILRLETALWGRRAATGRD